MFLAIFKNKLALCIYGEKRMETDHISVNIGSTWKQFRFFISVLGVLDKAKNYFTLYCLFKYSIYLPTPVPLFSLAITWTQEVVNKRYWRYEIFKTMESTPVTWAGISKQSMGARNRVGIGYRTGYICWRNSFLGLDSWAPWTFKNTVSVPSAEEGIISHTTVCSFLPLIIYLLCIYCEYTSIYS